jgi:hypothetical protein
MSRLLFSSPLKTVKLSLGKENGFVACFVNIYFNLELRARPT